MAECPGHCGHIELVRLVSHPGFIMKVKEVLETVFANCGKLKDDIVSRAFCFAPTRFAPHHPISWELSPHTMESPKPTIAP
ncbi:hypothetical protein FA13DRAFT_1853003 [Coprinellus micaceus]|uniref:DNA-directed RNA polymerase n=1 Tax=Coprinellus micaceus TaxID=71717 RepID=A0A4Y7SCI5_COPMI|nr:hypothetical protein FA13DRAFT_1853003 [Coprinellus micaceus]